MLSQAVHGYNPIIEVWFFVAFIYINNSNIIIFYLGSCKEKKDYYIR